MIARPIAICLCVVLAVVRATHAEEWRATEAGVELAGIELQAHQPFRELVALEGSLAPSFRFDGNSTWLESSDRIDLHLSEAFGIGAWVVLASPPVEGASVLHINGDESLSLGVNPWRQPEFRLGDLRVASFEALPMGQWVHLAVRYAAGTMRLYIDGREVAQNEGAAPETVVGRMTIGKRPDTGLRYETHPLGVWNGLIGPLQITRGAGPVVPGPPPGPPDVSVPDIWFAGDRLRPRIHPMPPAGWTNEPHTLLHRGGRWHLYHQANPNGAFWELMLWGHLVSDDLVHWDARLPALVPGTGFDRRGIWVGNLIPDQEPPAVLYTGVNGERAGLGRALWTERGQFERQEPAIAYDTPPGYQDMRDPYVVRTDDGWLALIGSGATDRTRALILAFSSEDSLNWSFLGEFNTGDVQMPGQYWELPVLRQLGDKWLLMGTPVIENAPTRTLYWLGGFDGSRFVPDYAEGRPWELFRTMLAPTLAEDDSGRTIAIGVLPDDGQRSEDVRAAAGWVHALSLPFEVQRCAADPLSICQQLAQETRDSFVNFIAQEDHLDLSNEPQVHQAGWTASRMTGTVTVPEGSTATVAVRATPDGAEETRFLLRPAEGLVALDRSDSSDAPGTRSDIVWAKVPRAETIDIDLVIDGAAITGTLGRHAFGLLVYPEADEATAIRLSADGAARFTNFALFQVAP